MSYKLLYTFWGGIHASIPPFPQTKNLSSCPFCPTFPAHQPFPTSLPVCWAEKLHPYHSSGDLEPHGTLPRHLIGLQQVWQQGSEACKDTYSCRHYWTWVTGNAVSIFLIFFFCCVNTWDKCSVLVLTCDEATSRPWFMDFCRKIKAGAVALQPVQLDLDIRLMPVGGTYSLILQSFLSLDLRIAVSFCLP